MPLLDPALLERFLLQLVDMLDQEIGHIVGRLEFEGKYPAEHFARVYKVSMSEIAVWSSARMG